MDPQQVRALGPAFSRFLMGFACCFARRPTLDNFLAYCRGLLGAEDRRSVEPMAIQADVGVRTLQLFLSQGRWEHDRLRDMMQQRIAQHHQPPPGGARAAEDLGTIGIADETGHVKKGEKTPGVQRQYCGHSGKVDNCIVTVHLAFVHGGFQALIDRDLFLPEDWANDRPRCREAHIPDALAHRPKWKIALEQLDRARGNGIALDWYVFDEGYGTSRDFLEELDQRGQVYVGEVPANFLAWARRPKYSSLRSEHAPGEVRHLARWSRPFQAAPWEDFKIERKTDGPQHWRVKAAQVYLPRQRGAQRRPTDRTYWLIWAWNPATDESKYFISSAPPTTPLARILRVAFGRSPIEHLFRISKGHVGLSHFEGRSYPGLIRHLTLCQLVLLFLAEQSAEQRGEKSAGDDGAVGAGAQRHVRSVA